MFQPKKLFDNFLNDRLIIPTRLLTFASETLNTFIANNDTNLYDTPIAILTPLVATLQAEIGDVDTSVNQKKGATLTVDKFVTGFSDTMSKEEPFIARALGGADTDAYLEFYPNGVAEYSKPAKTDMATLTGRVKAAATKYTAALGAPLTATLQAFATGWTTARDTQQQKMGTVDTNRTERSANRTALELGLLETIHFVGNKFPGDTVKCLSFFKFNLLFGTTKHKHKTFSGTIDASDTIEVLNRLFTDTATLTIRNTDDNAGIFVWLAATLTEAMPTTALEVLPGNSHEVKPSQLGPLTHPFLLIHNSSSVNEGAWEVEVVG